MLAIPVEAARRFVVAHQRLVTRRRTATPAELEAVIDRLGCVQLDAISAVDRSQRLVLGARAGAVPTDAVDRLLREGRVFEYWAHEASLIPVRDYPMFAVVMRDDSHHRWFGDVVGRNPELVDRILGTAREQGPVSARDFGGAGTGYWGWSEPKRVLEALWTAGRLAVAHRRGIERRYDLPERVLPAEVLGAPEPSVAERERYLVRRSVAARGLIRERRIHDYYRLRGGAVRLRPVVDALVADGSLARVRLEPDGDTGLVPAELVERLVDGSSRPRGAHLLSPFDNLLWDREEARALFGFDHLLEIYKPAAQRVWGYYVLPLVDGANVVGRIDAKADRRAGVLRALAVHWEGRARPRALREALARLAWRLGLEETEVRGGVRDARPARRPGA